MLNVLKFSQMKQRLKFWELTYGHWVYLSTPHLSFSEIRSKLSILWQLAFSHLKENLMGKSKWCVSFFVGYNIMIDQPSKIISTSVFRLFFLQRWKSSSLNPFTIWMREIVNVISLYKCFNEGYHHPYIPLFVQSLSSLINISVWYSIIVVSLSHFNCIPFTFQWGISPLLYLFKSLVW